MDPEGFHAWHDEGFNEWPGLQPKAKKPKVEAVQQCSNSAAQLRCKSVAAASLDHKSAGLKAMAGAAAIDARQQARTTYQEQGADPDDVKRRLASATCRCKRRCAARVQLRSLLTVCSLFWSLTHEDRGTLLRHIYQSALGDDTDQEEEAKDSTVSKLSLSRARWSIAGAQVCFPTFCALLKTGPNTVRKQIQGVPSLQRSTIGADRTPASRKHAQSDAVDWFFQELYHSAAEPLPEDAKCAFDDAGVFLQDQDASMQFEDSFGAAAGAAVQQSSKVAAILPSSHPADQLSDRAASLSWISAATMITVASAASVIGLAVRYLPHVTLADLYAQFNAAWEAQVASASGGFPAIPSFTTFCRRWSTRWRKVLRMRKSSQHAQCQTCFDLQKQLRGAASSWGAKLQAARDLRQHYNDQYMDRCLYWSMRHMSRYGSDILCIIIDSMDKAKFAWPRWPFERLSKELSSLNRPRTVLTAAIAHGWCTMLFMHSEFVNQGSDSWCEILSRVLDEVLKISKATGRKFPRHLVIQADNTCGVAKNQYCLRFLVFLIACHKFVSANLCYLMVGHTHEDIDQLFAVVLFIMLQLRTWQTPQELLDHIVSKLRAKVSDKGEVLIAVQLSSIHDFKSWLAPLGLELDWGFKTRQGIEAPHAFIVKMGASLSPAECAMMVQLPGNPAVEHTAVYCCVKAYMRDAKLQQPPVYCIPAERTSRVLDPAPTAMVPRHPLSKNDIETFLRLARLCKEELDLPQAAEALSKLVRDRGYYQTRLTWLESFKQEHWLEALAVQTSNPHFPHLPETSWALSARLR